MWTVHVYIVSHITMTIRSNRIYPSRWNVVNISLCKMSNSEIIRVNFHSLFHFKHIHLHTHHHHHLLQRLYTIDRHATSNRSSTTTFGIHINFIDEHTQTLMQLNSKINCDISIAELYKKHTNTMRTSEGDREGELLWIENKNKDILQKWKILRVNCFFGFNLEN